MGQTMKKSRTHVDDRLPLGGHTAPQQKEGELEILRSITRGPPGILSTTEGGRREFTRR